MHGTNSSWSMSGWARPDERIDERLDQRNSGYKLISRQACARYEGGLGFLEPIRVAIVVWQPCSYAAAKNASISAGVVSSLPSATMLK